jgi:peptidoglycan/LPS O-acetylase OafA/YrhL
VNLFFILSGFVLFLPYAAGQRVMASWADVRHFYGRRFLRLMPLYYFAAVVILVLAGPMLDSAGFATLATDLATVRFALRPRHFAVAIN